MGWGSLKRDDKSRSGDERSPEFWHPYLQEERTNDIWHGAIASLRHTLLTRLISAARLARSHKRLVSSRPLNHLGFFARWLRLDFI